MNRHRLILISVILSGTGSFFGFRAFMDAQAQIPMAAQNPLVSTTAVKRDNENTPQAGIKKITEEYVKAFNSKDAKAVAALWTAEGEYFGVQSEAIRGRAEIEKSFSELFKAHPKDTVEIQVESVRVIGRQTALADGVVKLIDPDGGDGGETHYSAIHVLEDGRWRAASVREWRPDPDRTASTKLLDWLVGEWTAAGSGGNFSLAYKWDENKTFLHGVYSLTKDGKTVSSGTQIIGTNPSGGLRSWVFDSNGTFSSALLQREGHHWIDAAIGMLPDGTDITSINVLIPLGPDAFTWQSTHREANGIAISPLPPIKVTRIKPAK